jgi:hypothetical protein
MTTVFGRTLRAALSSLRDRAAKASRRFAHQSTFASYTTNSRPMTEAERKAFDAAFAKMDDAFAEMGKAFGNLK